MSFMFLSCRLLPRAMCNSQRIYCCFGLKMEACANSNLAKTSLVAGFATGWSKTQSLYIRQPANCHSLPLGALLTSKTQDISSKPFTGDEEIGVLLLNLGGPETLDDVQPFLFNLFADPVKFLYVLYPSQDRFLSTIVKYFFLSFFHVFFFFWG